MEYLVTHTTQYRYSETASLSYNEAWLTPRTFQAPLFTQTCLEHRIDISPRPSDQRVFTDFFENQVRYFTVRFPHEATTITAISRVRLDSPPHLIRPVEQLLQEAARSEAWDSLRHRLHHELEPDLLDARQYTLASPLVPVLPDLAAYAAPSFPEGRPIIETVYHLMGRIYEEFDFVPGATTIATPVIEVLREKRGVCQDFAHLMLGCLRAQGLAARYVSGYIETVPPPGQEKLQGADASHAWVAVYVPGLNWLAFDPTNNLLPHDQHITVAWGRDYGDVPPLKGVFFSHGEHKLKVAVDVERLTAAAT